MTREEFWTPVNAAAILYLLRTGVANLAVIAAKTGLDHGDVAAFLNERGSPQDPWTWLPGVKPCPFTALTDYYRDHAAEVDPIIRDIGGPRRSLISHDKEN
jgi:hypothetical protein